MRRFNLHLLNNNNCVKNVNDFLKALSRAVIFEHISFILKKISHKEKLKLKGDKKNWMLSS